MADIAPHSVSSSRPWTTVELRDLREHYGREPARDIAARLDRSFNAITHQARRLGLASHRRWTERDDARLIDLWGSFSVPTLARQIGRTSAATYVRARQLGLTCGATRGLEYLSHAAKRTGFGVGQLRRILWRWRVRVVESSSRPCGSRRHFHQVDPIDVDEAVAKFLATEMVGAAAKRLGLNCGVLRTWLRLAIEAGFDVPPEPRGHKCRWRVPSATIDQVIAWRAALESLSAAACRVGVSRFTITGWLRAAGVRMHGPKPCLVAKADVDRVAGVRMQRPEEVRRAG